MNAPVNRAQFAQTCAHMDALNREAEFERACAAREWDSCNAWSLLSIDAVPAVKPMNELLVALLLADRALTADEAAYVAMCEGMTA